MRRTVPLLVALLSVAGCVSPPAAETPPPVNLLVASDITVPEGATLEAIEGGFAAVWPKAALPIDQEFKVPANATMVRAVAEGPDGVRVSMYNDATGRRRCNTPTVESFSDLHRSPVSCSSVALLDEPGAVWHVRAYGQTGQAALRIEYLGIPFDGLLSGLRLDLIDPPTHELKPTEFLTVPSWDGTPLRVEVTLPEGPGPWPAVIESSPYHDDGVRKDPASWTYFVQDWAKRGYAIVVADVRGFGDSGGCVEVWGPNEQKDQAFLVDWTAQQEWSDGNVGFYGQSYVGTTPVEAAVLAPPALKAIVSVAPVINAYEDWHHGGVPDGESTGSPVAYQVLTEGDPGGRTDPQTIANNAANGLCDPTLIARANDPRAIYDAFYEERDFKRLAGNVKAATLYTQGFEDLNVKSTMIPGWFNAITAPKLGLFGHWLHQHPSRLDTEALMVAWMEQHLKGKDIGLGNLPAAAIVADREHHRTADAWPPTAPGNLTLWPDFGAGTLGPAAAPGFGTVYLDSTGGLAVPPGETATIALSGTVPEGVGYASVATVHVQGNLEGAAHAYLEARLYEESGDGDVLLSWGQFHLAHNADHTTYTPRTPTEVIEVDLPLRATEHVLEAGTKLRLELLGAAVTTTTDPFGVTGVRFTFVGGADGTRLVLPTVPLSDYTPMPLSARP
jgi:predicted acyl esterase